LNDLQLCLKLFSTEEDMSTGILKTETILVMKKADFKSSMSTHHFLSNNEVMSGGDVEAEDSEYFIKDGDQRMDKPYWEIEPDRKELEYRFGTPDDDNGTEVISQNFLSLIISFSR
jgi:hypothetical protein